MGLPSDFFRTSYCNLRCLWCDTPYTSWQPEDKDISVEDAVAIILDYVGIQSNHKSSEQYHPNGGDYL